MIKYETHLGQIGISQRYFEKLIGNAVSSCYGVTNMIPKGMKWWRSKLVKRRFADTGKLIVTGRDVEEQQFILSQRMGQAY